MVSPARRLLEIVRALSEYRLSKVDESLTFANRGRSHRTQVHGLEMTAEVGEAFPLPLPTHFVDGEQPERAVALGLGLVEPLVTCRLVGEVRVRCTVARDVGRLAPAHN